MRALIGIVFLCWGLVAFAQEQIIAEGTDQGPKVELKVPEQPKTPLIQTYYTDKGDLAAVVTPEEGDSYFYVPVQEAYQTQYPQYREADVPNNRSNWILLDW